MPCEEHPEVAKECPKGPPAIEVRIKSILEPGAVGAVLRAGDPGPATPVLCRASGTYIYDLNDYIVDGIKVLCVKIGDGSATGNPYASAEAEVEAVVSSADAIDVPDANIDRNDGTWFVNTSVGANIDRDPANKTWNKISVVFLVSPLNAEAPSLTAAQLLQGSAFQAEGTDACAVFARTSGVSASSQKGGACCQVTRTVPAMLQPLEVCDGWIHYSFFSQSGGARPMPPTNGFLLASPDCCETAISARSIAIATSAVDWRPRHGRNLVITRSHGILDTSVFDGSTRRRMQFDGLPKFCFLVHQLRNSASEFITRIPVDAECRDRPQRILLNPQEPFYVQVNNVQDDRTLSDGTLDFWVKILS